MRVVPDPREDDVPLPPAALRPGGPALQDDDRYLRFATESVEQLRRLVTLSSRTRLLDLGCGPGRLLIGLLREHVEFASYLGVDVDPAAVEWAGANLQARRPRIAFERVDVLNERYNRDGTSAVRLPVADRSRDVVTLFSVFSHMRLADVAQNLDEIARVLAPDGKVVLTAFVEQGVPAETENPEGYLTSWRGPLHCVRFDRHVLESMMHGAGFVVDAFAYRQHRGTQSIYVLRRRVDVQDAG